MADLLKYYVGITDTKWFNFLRGRSLTEVNFWRPSTVPFRSLEPGGPFLFRLHSPHHYIVGGGFFVRYLRLTLPMAWSILGEANGSPDYPTLLDHIDSHRTENASPHGEIGCILLTSPFFFDESEWIPIPEQWQRIFGPGQAYDTTDAVAGQLWQAVKARLQVHDNRVQIADPAALAVAEPLQRYGPEHLVKTRLGQPGFRAVVTDAYQRRCAISGEKTFPVLEAAHIRPYSEHGPHSLSNGLLLRADLHILFDKGYITVSNDLHVEVSAKIKEEYENGKDYYAFHGKKLQCLPHLKAELPDPTFLEWHQNMKYQR